MEKLYSILRDFLEVEYNQESLLYLLKVVEAGYNGEEQEEVKLITNSAKYYLKALQEEIRLAINRLDSYIIEDERKQ